MLQLTETDMAWLDFSSISEWEDNPRFTRFQTFCVRIIAVITGIERHQTNRQQLGGGVTIFLNFPYLEYNRRVKKKICYGWAKWGGGYNTFNTIFYNWKHSDLEVSQKGVLNLLFELR